MKNQLLVRLIALALLVGIYQGRAQTAQFFRIIGPTATTITAFNADGTIVWSGATPGATYQVQTATSFAGGANWLDYVQLPVTNDVNTNLLISFSPPDGMVLIPAGVFAIGDTLDGGTPFTNNIPTTNVYVSAFYMDENLVRFSQWHSVYDWATSNGYNIVNAGNGVATNHPVQTVNWYDCVAWCNARSVQTGLPPCYYTDAGLTQVYTNSAGTNVYWSTASNGYRLPTEAEWEKAARGGLIGQRFPWGNTISENQADYSAYPNPPNSLGFTYDLGPYSGYNTNFDIGGQFICTSPVGYFSANGYGLYDMAGNVFEWCWDWYSGPSAAGSPFLGGTDPRGPDGPLIYRVYRGGAWTGWAISLRCAYRYFLLPQTSGTFVGFRCVRGL
jgi:formylglycine-generating enzyme required for sulfatase activity